MHEPRRAHEHREPASCGVDEGSDAARTTSPPVGARTSASARCAPWPPVPERRRARGAGRAPASGPSGRSAGLCCGERPEGEPALRDARGVSAARSGAARVGRGTLPPVRGRRSCTVPAAGPPHITPTVDFSARDISTPRRDHPFGRLPSADGVDRAREGARAGRRGRLRRHRGPAHARVAARAHRAARLLHASCINCVHVLDELRDLERQFGDDLLVIGIHSPKFPHEHDHGPSCGRWNASASPIRCSTIPSCAAGRRTRSRPGRRSS